MIIENITNVLLCPGCIQTTIQYHKINKQGCATKVMLSCECGWEHMFWTSKKVSSNKNRNTDLQSNYRGFEINKRFLYAMRNCGQGHSWLETFCTLMNMPPPSTRKNYKKQSKLLNTIVKAVAEDTMCNAAAEIHSINSTSEEVIINCGVSSDGSWQRKQASKFYLP